MRDRAAADADMMQRQCPGTPASARGSVDHQGVNVTEFRASLSYPRFKVGDDGTIVGPSGRVLKAFVGNKGYRCITAYTGSRTWKQLRVHFLVCEAFHGERPDGAQVAHCNGDRLDNRASNLRWSTSWQNEADKRSHGTAHIGEAHPRARLTEAKVREIRARWRPGMLATLASEYGVGQSTIWNVITRNTWGNVT